MLSSAGSSTESSGYTETSSKASLHSPSVSAASTAASSSAAASAAAQPLKGERDTALRSAAQPSLRPFVARPAPPRPSAALVAATAAAVKERGSSQGALKKPKKDARRAEIVAAVTKRLYTTKKKSEGDESAGGAEGGSATAPSDTAAPAAASDEPPELQLCARARARLQELSRRALGARRRPPQADAACQTDFPTHTTRLKEKAVETDWREYLADAAVGTRESPGRVVRVREVGTAPDGVEVSTSTSSSLHIHTCVSNGQMPLKDINVLLDPSALHPTESDHHKFDSNCFDCYLQCVTEDKTDGSSVLAYQELKSKSNQCNLFDGELDSKQVAVDVIPHARTWIDSSDTSRDVAVSTDKCFFHMQLQKYAGVTAIPSPPVRTVDRGIATNNVPVYSCVSERTNQLPIRDRVTNNIYDRKVIEEKIHKHPSYLKTFRPYLPPTDTYIMRKSLGTQTLSSRSSNGHLLRESSQRCQLRDNASSTSYSPKKCNFEKRVSRGEHCCRSIPNNFMYKQIDECFSDDSLDSCKSGDWCVEPDSLNDMQPFENLNHYRHCFFMKKDKVQTSFFNNTNQLCPVHNKNISCPRHSKRPLSVTSISKQDVPLMNTSTSVYQHYKSKSQIDQELERCNILKEGHTCESRYKCSNTRNNNKSSYEYRGDERLDKVMNTHTTVHTNSLHSNVSSENTALTENHSKLRTWSDPYPTLPMFKLQSTSAQSQHNTPFRPYVERNSAHYFTVNDTPLYTFSKCNSGFIAKEVTSFSMSPFNFQQTGMQYQSTQAKDGEKTKEPQYIAKNNTTEDNTQPKRKNSNEKYPSTFSIAALLCEKCSEKISTFKEDIYEKIALNSKSTNTLNGKDPLINHDNELLLRKEKNEHEVINQHHSESCSGRDKSTSTDFMSHSNFTTTKNEKLPIKFVTCQTEKMLTPLNCEHNSEMKSDLYSIIAFPQTHEKNLNETLCQVNSSEEADVKCESSCPPSQNTITNRKDIKDSKPGVHSDILSKSLCEIKECVQKIESNIGKHYQTNVDVKSYESESPTEITLKWVFNKSLPCNNTENQSESEGCTFETLITLDKSNDLTSNWEGLLKVSKISKNSKIGEHKMQGKTTEQSPLNLAQAKADGSSKLQTYVDNAHISTNMHIDIELGNANLRRGTIKFGNNYTTFDTKVQNFELLLILCDSLFNLEPKTKPQTTEANLTKFPENTVITFKFEDGGYQPLLNIVTRQSINCNLSNEIIDAMKHDFILQESHKNNLGQSLGEENNPHLQNTTDLSNANGSNSPPVNNNDKCMLNNLTKSESKENVEQKLNDQESNEITKNDDCIVKDISKSTLIIDTQPLKQGIRDISPGCFSLPNPKPLKQNIKEKPNIFNAMFIKKPVKRKRRCTPLSAPSCIWNFTDERSVPEEEHSLTSKTCSTLSSFIKKANSLLTRLNEVSTMLDKNRKKSESDTSVLLSDHNLGLSDDDIEKSLRRNKFINHNISTINVFPKDETVEVMTPSSFLNSSSSSPYQPFSKEDKRASKESSCHSKVPSSTDSLYLSGQEEALNMQQNIHFRETPLLSFTNSQKENIIHKNMQESLGKAVNSGTWYQPYNNQPSSPSIFEQHQLKINEYSKSVENDYSQIHAYNPTSISSMHNLTHDISLERKGSNCKKDTDFYKIQNACTCDNDFSLTCGTLQKISSRPHQPCRKHDETQDALWELENNKNISKVNTSLNKSRFPPRESQLPNSPSKYSAAVTLPVNIQTSEQSTCSTDNVYYSYTQVSKTLKPLSSQNYSQNSRTNHFKPAIIKRPFVCQPPSFVKSDSSMFPEHHSGKELLVNNKSLKESFPTNFLKKDTKIALVPIHNNQQERDEKSTGCSRKSNLTSKGLQREKSQIPTTDPADTSYLSSLLASPRAYMQYLLQLRRQIVVASGLDTNIHYTSLSQSNSLIKCHKKTEN